MPIYQETVSIDEYGKDKIDLASFADKNGLVLADMDLSKLKLTTNVEVGCYDSMDIWVHIEYKQESK